MSSDTIDKCTYEDTGCSTIFQHQVQLNRYNKKKKKLYTNSWNAKWHQSKIRWSYAGFTFKIIIWQTYFFCTGGTRIMMRGCIRVVMVSWFQGLVIVYDRGVTSLLMFPKHWLKSIFVCHCLFCVTPILQCFLTPVVLHPFPVQFCFPPFPPDPS